MVLGHEAAGIPPHVLDLLGGAREFPWSAPGRAVDHQMTSSG
jgi:hypothetical protein